MSTQEILIDDGHTVGVGTDGGNECCVNDIKVALLARFGECVLDADEGPVRDVVAEMRRHGGGVGGILREQSKGPTQSGGTDGLGVVDAESEAGRDRPDTAEGGTGGDVLRERSHGWLW